MKTLPLLALSGCLVTHSDLNSEEETKCAPQIEALERACVAREGKVKETADALKACLGETVKIRCSWGDSLENNILTISK